MVRGSVKHRPKTSEISLDGEIHVVTLKWSDRRKTIQISINQEQQIIVHAPSRLKMTEIEALLEKRTMWLQKNLQKVAESSAKKFVPQWMDGECHFYLGEQYPLKLEYGDRLHFDLEDDVFRVCILEFGDRHQIQFLMRRWYQRQAKTLFRERLDYWTEKTKPILELEQKSIPLRIRVMKTRWGSCSSLGRINLNLQLIQMPLGCLDYVIVHELCHFREMNHSKRFWDLVTQCMPDWQSRRAALKQASMATWLQ